MENKRVQFTKPKRVVLYCRVATDDQHDTALEAQAQSLRAYAEARGDEIVKIIQERGAGTTMDRTGIRALYILAGRRAMDEVLAKSISRYTRGPISELASLIETLADNGIATATMQEGNLNDIIPVREKQ